ncbi:MAG: hypothetical protein IID08_06260 [Candidatus Hydrogenedentes bacterium]|nr:hypothetical protein [Candidatus Hydrogenedentota bacterium]
MITLTRSMTTLLLATLLLGFPTGVRAEDVTVPVEDVAHGRVSFADDTAMIKGVDDDEWSYATVNALVFEGDTVWADQGGALELEFLGGTFVRMADGSKLAVGSIGPDASVRGHNGSFYVHLLRSATAPATFDYSSGSISVAPATQVRIDMLSEGSTTVSVRWGSVTVTAESGAPITVGAGERVYIDPGYAPTQPESFDLDLEDDFDTWNRDRARQVAYGKDDSPIFRDTYSSAPIGTWALRDHGEWIYVDDRYYWRPLVVDYVPYRRGYWSYTPGGHVWVGYHPFSYVTTHYGYWDHHDTHGWIWSYHHEYAPARVASYRYGDLFIWTPINHHGHAVYWGNDTFLLGSIRIGFHFSSFAYASDLLYGHHGVHALQRHHLRRSPGHHTYAWNLHGDRHQRVSYSDHSVPTHRYSPDRVMRGGIRGHKNDFESAGHRARTLEARATRRHHDARISNGTGRAHLERTNARREALRGHDARQGRVDAVREVRLPNRQTFATMTRPETRRSHSVNRDHAPGRPARSISHSTTRKVEHRVTTRAVERSAPQRQIEDNKRLFNNRRREIEETRRVISERARGNVSRETGRSHDNSSRSTSMTTGHRTTRVSPPVVTRRGASAPRPDARPAPKARLHPQSYGSREQYSRPVVNNRGASPQRSVARPHATAPSPRSAPPASRGGGVSRAPSHAAPQVSTHSRGGGKSRDSSGSAHGNRSRSGRNR